MTATIAKLFRYGLLLMVPLVSGWFGFALSFSDRSPGETVFERTALILGAQMVGGAAVGLLSPTRWYLSVLAAWGSLFWFLLRPSAAFDTPPPQFPEDLIHPPWVPPAAVALTILLGYAASRARNRESRS